ncbi:MAG TPA: ubiquinone-dependent pyruvate dehydrogenase [Acidobacteriaceae bacterium]
MSVALATRKTAKMSKKIVGELLIETLIAAGVKHVFGLAGDSLNGITHCMRPNNAITWIPVRHEEVAAFAAGAEAHLTGSLAVCAGSCGPGNMHLINGLYDCHRSRVPVLAIAAHIPSNEIGSGYFQETHPERLFLDCSHYCELVSQPGQMPRVLEIAIQTAISRKGVAVVVIPADVTFKEAMAPQPRLRFKPSEPLLRPSDKDLSNLASTLDSAEKITILAGAGCAGAHTELINVADRLQAPIVHAMRGKEFIEYDNPFDVGMAGLFGFSSGYYAMMNCDTLLMLGTDFPYQQFFPENATTIQIDNRAEQIGKRTKIDIGLVGDVKATLEALTPQLTPKQNRSHLNQWLEHYRKARKGLDDLATGVPGRKPIHPQYVAKVVDELATEDAVFTCDVGTPTIWAARYLTMNGKRRLLGSFNHGSMANALPQAIGAQTAFPDRQVVSLSGDGGLTMLMGDLLTLRQLSLPVKVVVFNNGALAFRELEMRAAGILDFATDLENPNFAEVAKAIGLFGARVESPEDLGRAMKEAFVHHGPGLIDVVTNRQELSLPPTIELKQAIGDSL